MPALSEALSRVSLLPCLCFREGRLVLGPPGAPRHGLCSQRENRVSEETPWSPGAGEVYLASCPGMNSDWHPAHRALVSLKARFQRGSMTLAGDESCSHQIGNDLFAFRPEKVTSLSSKRCQSLFHSRILENCLILSLGSSQILNG